MKTMKEAILSRAELLFNAILDSIIAFTDFFIIRKHVTLSEGMLFSLSLARATWFTLFGVNIGPNTAPLSHEAWAPVFWLLTLAHFISFFIPRTVVRVGIMCVYGVMWCFLALLVAISSIESPAFPTFLIFSFLSVFIAVRLMRDQKD